jgi:ATP phosphoribosyltransferase regulatory subunit
MLKEALKLSNNSRCKRAVENIQQVYEILKDYRLDSYITFDLGMVQSINYYTGIIFRGITKELGYPICGGGRYDNLVSEFGYDLPATGFAMGIKRVLIALERQQGLKKIPNIDVLVSCHAQGRKNLFPILKDLREQGLRVEKFLSVDHSEDPVSYAQRKGIPRIIKIEGENIIETNIT